MQVGRTKAGFVAQCIKLILWLVFGCCLKWHPCDPFFIFFVKYRRLIFSTKCCNVSTDQALCCLIPIGFPNVTMAPNCDLESSQGPIVKKSHPPSQLSILSESVMDSQVMYILFHASMSCGFFVCTKWDYSKIRDSRFLLITFIEEKVKERWVSFVRLWESGFFNLTLRYEKQTSLCLVEALSH